jgi:hypothetical protein
VPALVPSALGTSLNIHRRDRYSVCSSSASSTSWSLVTDEEEGDTLPSVDSDWHREPSEQLHENPTKLSGHLYPMPPSGLSYARKPSGTNNHSTVPLLHRRTSSGSSPGNVHGVPRSAPIPSLTSPVHLSAEEDEAYNSDIEFTPDRPRPTEGRKSKDKGSTLTAKPRRTRNRASLPAYFSLLQFTGSSNPRTTHVSTSSGTAAPPHLSPSTPKMSLAGLPHSHGVVQATPRGRRLEAAMTRDGHKARSRSPRPPHAKAQHAELRQCVEQAFDITCAPAPRGRAAVRRNSSPPQKMIVNGTNLGSDSGSRTRTRGRVRVEELNGLRPSSDAPGFGSGRSGLVSRERAGGSRGAIGLS